MTRSSWINRFVLVIVALGSLTWLAGSASALGRTGMASSPDSSASNRAQNAAEQEKAAGPESVSPFSAAWEVGFVSKYLFQGLDYSGGRPALQPGVAFSLRGFSTIVWSNHNIREGVFDEFDLSVQHEWETAAISVATGYTYLTYPHRPDWRASQELYAELSCRAPLDPALSIHYDFDAGKGMYNALSVGHTVETLAATLSIGASCFFQSRYYGATGIPAVEMNGTIEWPLGPVILAPGLSRFFRWENGDFRDDDAVPASWLVTITVGQDLQ